MKDMDNVKLVASTLSTPVKYIMDHVLEEVMEYYRADQVRSCILHRIINGGEYPEFWR